MPPQQRVVARFAAEPPQEGAPYGRWEERLREEFSAAFEQMESEDESLGEPRAVVFYPDRTWHGRTYVPFTSLTSTSYELFGYIRFVPGSQDSPPHDFFTHLDFTEETAERNPDWQLDLCDEVIGTWRGEGGAVAAMTLVWGRPLVRGGRIVTAELGDVTVDQCELLDECFTLIAPDDYRHELLEIKLWGAKAQELASESLYESEEQQAQE